MKISNSNFFFPLCMLAELIAVCSFSEGAFLQSVEYVEAMLLCLQAVESNKVAILADINPKLVSVFVPMSRWFDGSRALMLVSFVSLYFVLVAQWPSEKS